MGAEQAGLGLGQALQEAAVTAGHGLVSECVNLGQRLDDESDSLVMTSVTQLHNRTSVSVTN